MVRIPWDRYEVALLLNTYERVADGADISTEAARLSETLRDLAILRGVSIDDTYRNVNGMKMQLANVQYLFTDGQKGLSGASAMIRQMYELYKINPAEYQTVLKEAIRLTSLNESVEDAFFAYAKERISLSPSMMAEYLKKATTYCHLKQPLLGMTDVKAVRNVQQKVAEGKLLHFRYGKDAQTIRAVTHLYYTFIKSYREPPKELPVQKISAEGNTISGLRATSDTEAIDIEADSENKTVAITEANKEGSANMPDLNDFRTFLVQNRHLAGRTAVNYWTSIRMIEDYIRRNQLSYSLVEASSENVQNVIDALMSRPDFVRVNDERHHQYSAAMAQYVSFLRKGTSASCASNVQQQAASSNTIKDAVVAVLQGASSPMSASSILENIQQRGLYHFNTDNPLGVVTSTIRQHCVGIEFPDRSEEKPFRMIRGENGRSKFYLKKGWSEQVILPPTKMTIKDAVIAVLRGLDEPMSATAILERIQSQNLYQFKTEKPLPIVLKTIKLNCEYVSDPRLSWEKVFRFVLDENGKQQYLLVDVSQQSDGGSADSTEGDASKLAEIREHILSFVFESFPHGIRPTSIIDINKLKRLYQAKGGEEMPADVDITTLLRSVGLQSGEKVYFLSEGQKQSLCSLITDIIRNGHRVIYYRELFSLHGELFEACHIYEKPLMQTVLQSILPEYSYKAEWMLVDQKANEIEEITEAFGDDVILTYQQLKNRCPYLTMSVIKGVLSRSDRFVWSSPETYAQVDLIELDQNEVSDIVNRILPLIREEGYFSLAQLPIEESCGLNPQVSSSAVRDAIFNRYMSNEFTRNGLIVKRPELRLSSYQLMETWLKGLDQVTLAEVEDYERELTGHHAVLGIVAASSTMVRIDHDHYVSDASIQFNVDAVDHAISLFVGNRIIPITAITSYTSFPDVPGYNWNLYLVESFLRRFSKRFTIDGGPAQMSYVGGISSAERHFDSYEDRLAHAVIQDGVTLTEEAIGRYLTDRKFILRRSETVRKTLDRARILNEQRGDPSVRI